MALSVPSLFVVGSAFIDASDVWRHLVNTVLKDYLINSCWLILGVGTGVALIGLSTAWLISLCDFPGRAPLAGALILPLAMPAYLLAYTYGSFLDFFGPLQTGLRQLFGWQSAPDYWFPEIRSLGGAALMLILVLYPYVFMLARVAFQQQANCALEASRSLGCSPWQSFWQISLPLARPAIAAGTALALMETLSDFGTVEYFGVNTFTTGIFKAWFDFGEPAAAAQLGTALLGFIVTLILLEQYSRRQARYYHTTNRQHSPNRYVLNPIQTLFAWCICGLPLLLALVLPSAYLLWLAITNSKADPLYWALTRHSFTLAGVTALFALTTALVLSYSKRLASGPFLNTAVHLASLGYAIPGAVIAVGVLLPAGYLDQGLARFHHHLWGSPTSWVVSGTLSVLIFAYLVRFLAVALGSVDTGLTKIKPSLDEAARGLGKTQWRLFPEVHFPLLRQALLSAFLLVFVDVTKELPATLILRPFNFDTLAVRLYQYASDERLAAAALPALTIVALGLLPACLLALNTQTAPDK
ncbi:MAG: iron ABC transporter permease [Cyanobacteria bacterium P01_H01_bin.15]